MLGIRFYIENEFNNYLDKIFSEINLNDYYWHVSETQIFKKDSLKNIDLPNELMTGKEFRKVIELQNYYMVSANIKAYPSTEDLKEILKINSYNDFVHSKCEFMMLCDDNVIIDIICKSETILNKFMIMVQKNCFKNMIELTEENFGWNTLHV